MVIRVENFNDLYIDKKGVLSYQSKEINRGWGKTYYSLDGNALICRRFNLFGVILHHLFGYKKEFNAENLSLYLKKNIKALSGKDNITQKVAFQALEHLQDVKRDFFLDEKNQYKDEARAIALFESGELDVNAYPKFNHNTALMVACERGQLGLVKYLVEHGADVNLEVEGRKAWYSACMYSRHPEIIEYLLDKGVDLNAIGPGNKSGFAQMVSAYLRDPNRFSLELIKKALQKKPDLSLRGSDGDPLFMACQRGNLELAKLLMDHGAKLSADSREYLNHFYAAISSANVDLVMWILDQGVDFHRENDALPLETAIRFNVCILFKEDQQLKMAAMLIERGFVPKGRTVSLENLIGSLRLTVIKCLVENGVKIDKAADLEYARHRLSDAEEGHGPESEARVAALKEIIAYLEALP